MFNKNMPSDAIDIICETFNIMPSEICNVEYLKKGMTNVSFLFVVDSNKYIIRIPGAGTEKLINRAKEYSVYEVIKNLNISDDIVYSNPGNGYKITKFFENSRVCNPLAISDVKDSMSLLKHFHSLRLKVEHQFDIFNQIDFYESLCPNDTYLPKDYSNTKENVFSLKSFLDKLDINNTLTHIDAVPDNFLFLESGEIRIIDWEYSGMCDPHVDIAMFAIYSMYDHTQINKLIDIYFEGGCNDFIRTKIYCYVSMCGLLWSNWCSYKKSLGIEFGQYAKRQYYYASEYYSLATANIKELS